MDKDFSLSQVWKSEEQKAKNNQASEPESPQKTAPPIDRNPLLGSRLPFTFILILKCSHFSTFWRGCSLLDKVFNLWVEVSEQVSILHKEDRSGAEEHALNGLPGTRWWNVSFPFQYSCAMWMKRSCDERPAEATTIWFRTFMPA